VFDVVEVVLEFFHGVFNRGAVGEVDLRPAGQAGFYQVPRLIKRNLFFKFPHEFRAFGPWADEAHFSFEHVPELGEFVQPAFAEEIADFGDTSVFFFRPFCPVFFRVLNH